MLEFGADGSLQEQVKSAATMGLHPRDVNLFVNNRVFYKHRATIIPRDRAVLVRTEIIKAIIYQDKALLFPCRWVFPCTRHWLSLFTSIPDR